jgi:hypothetical protein
MEGKEERLLVMDAEERRRAEGCLNMRGLVFHHLLHMFRNLSALLLSSQVAEVCVGCCVGGMRRMWVEITRKSFIDQCCTVINEIILPPKIKL